MQETSTRTRVRRPAEGARVPYRSLPVPQTERDPPCLSTRKVNPPYYPQAGEGRPSCPAAGPGDGKHSSADEEPSPPRTLTFLHCTFIFLLLTTSLPCPPFRRSLPLCLTPWSVCLLDEMPPHFWILSQSRQNLQIYPAEFCFLTVLIYKSGALPSKSQRCVGGRNWGRGRTQQVAAASSLKGRYTVAKSTDPGVRTTCHPFPLNEEFS